MFHSDDGKVRKVETQRENEKPGEAANKYSGLSYTKIEKSVQRVVIIIPDDEHDSTV